MGERGKTKFKLRTTCSNIIINYWLSKKKKKFKLFGNVEFNYLTTITNCVPGSIVTNVPCCEVLKNPQPQTECIPFGTACSNRSQYSFWDAVHPTEVGYVVYGGRAYRAQSPADAYPHDIEHLAQS